MHYEIPTDILLVEELLGLTTVELANMCGLGSATLERWLSGRGNPSASKLAALYDFAYEQGLRINQIKAQLHSEQLGAQGRLVLFHGAKSEIEGPLSLDKSKLFNDFGQGFYCGESLEQSAMFVADRKDGSLYIVGFDAEGLRQERFFVDEDWMLAVAWFRGRIPEYGDHARVRAIRERVQRADYIVAPIADNRMFETIDTFIDGEITDLQCRHSISATNLGQQFVFTSQAALARAQLIERCFLSPAEKAHYLQSKREQAKVGADKAKVARRQFRGRGQYIDELLS